MRLLSSEKNSGTKDLTYYLVIRHYCYFKFTTLKKKKIEFSDFTQPMNFFSSWFIKNLEFLIVIVIREFRNEIIKIWTVKGHFVRMASSGMLWKCPVARRYENLQCHKVMQISEPRCLYFGKCSPCCACVGERERECISLKTEWLWRDVTCCVTSTPTLLSHSLVRLSYLC